MPRECASTIAGDGADRLHRHRADRLRGGRPTLEVQLDAERDEAHEILRHRRDFAKIRTGWTCIRVPPVLPVEAILPIDAHLDSPAGPDAHVASQVHVEEAQPLATPRLSGRDDVMNNALELDRKNKEGGSRDARPALPAGSG